MLSEEDMKKSAVAILFLCGIAVFSQEIMQESLSAKDSDPNKMGWMQGFPPSESRIVNGIDGSFFEFPALRYSVSHMREFMPTTEVQSALEKNYTFKERINKNIDSIMFTPWGETEQMTFSDSLEKTYTDGMLILHKGKIVYEKYFGSLTKEGVHAAMSVSKTFTGTLGALLIAEGVLDETKTASFYVPELENSAYGDATIRQILDMTVSLKYSEDYSDPNAEIWAFSTAGNIYKPAGYTGPSNYYEYLATVQKDPSHEHGEVFAYKTINTDAMAWIISRVTGKSIPHLLSERIWKPLGANVDGYYQIGSDGLAFAGGGFGANLRDMAMFGEMIRKDGRFNRNNILPKAVVQDIKAGGDKTVFARSTFSSTLKDWSYRDMWWITGNENGAFAARGVYGQTIYIDPTAEMVLVRFASFPVAANSYIDPYSLPAYQAVADYLMKK